MQIDGTIKYHPEWGNPITKVHTWYSLADKWILAQKLAIPKIQFTNHMTLKQKEHQSMDTLILLRMWTKISMEWVTETKCGAETKGMTIQTLPHLGIHPIYSHQTQILLWMPISVYWQKPVIAVSGEATPVPDKYRGGCSQPTIGLNTESPMEEPFFERQLTHIGGGLNNPRGFPPTTILLWERQHVLAAHRRGLCSAQSTEIG